MSVLMGVLNIARHALSANQRALAITAQNIANVNTKGYARQEVVFGSFATANGEVPTDHQGPLGMGVLIDDVRRAGGSMNTVLEERIALGESNLGRLRARNELFGRIESVLNDSSATGLNKVMSDFFNAVQDVINDPANIPARQVLLERARTLAQRFVTADTQMAQVADDANAEIERLIAEVNAETKQIAHFNDLIATATASGLDTNELRNQRRLVMNSLAEKIGFTAVEDPLNLGKVTITAQGAAPIVLVEAGTSQILSTTRDLVMADVTVVSPSGPISGMPINGRIGGLGNLRDVVVPDMRRDLDLLAATFIDRVNNGVPNADPALDLAGHSAGFGLLGTSGLALFSGTKAGDMAVAITDPNQVAASSSLGGVPGNNDVMLDIAVLQNTDVVDPVGGASPTATLQEFYNTLIAKIGAGAQDAQNTLSAENVVQDELTTLKSDTSGVSLDDELINVIKYQRAFEAAARLVTVTDELLLTLINLKR